MLLTRLVLAIAICVVAGGCSKSSPSTGSKELDSYEKDTGAKYEGVYISKSGAYINRKQAVAPGDLTKPGALRAAIAAAKPAPKYVVFDIDDEPVAVAHTALRDLAETNIHNGYRTPTSRIRSGTWPLDVRVHDKSLKTAQRPTLSIDVLPDRVWVGVSQLNEFQEIPYHAFDGPPEIDWDKLETTLKEHKASDLFNETTTAEIAVDPSLKSSSLLRVIDIAVKVGFIGLAIIPRAELTAKALLPEVIDVAGLASPADIVARLRKSTHPDGIEVRNGETVVCDWLTIVTSGPKDVVARVRKGGAVKVTWVGTTTEITDGEELRGYLLRVPANKTVIEIGVEPGVDSAAFLKAIQAACGAAIGRFMFST